jgi:hypothetical protein
MITECKTIIMKEGDGLYYNVCGKWKEMYHQPYKYGCSFSCKEHLLMQQCSRMLEERISNHTLITLIYKDWFELVFVPTDRYVILTKDEQMIKDIIE